MKHPAHVVFSYTCSCRIHTDAMNNRRNDKDAGRLL